MYAVPKKIKTLLGFSDRKELNMESPGRYPHLIYNLPAHCCTYHSIPDSSCIGSYIYAAKKQGKYKQSGLLLATFIALFIFIGNLGRIPQFSSFLKESWQEGKHLLLLLASQIMSNVPAALLLSGFTDNYRALIVGTNIGGLGTLIASMASLISFKYIAKENRNLRGKYLGIFTASNIIFMIFMLVAISG